MRAGRLAPVLEAACDAMTSLTIYPLIFEADAKGAYVLATMPEPALRTRSRGPYSSERLPSEAMALIDWVALRWSVKPERPEFTIEGGDVWPRLVLSLPASRVLVRFVVPEDAPPIHEPAPHNVSAVVDIKMGLKFVAQTLETAARTLGDEPPVTIRLAYPDNPDCETQRAGLPAEFRDLILPVTPTVEVDRSRCRRRDLEAHNLAIRSVAYTDQRVEAVGRNGFTTRIGSACVRDLG